MATLRTSPRMEVPLNLCNLQQTWSPRKKSLWLLSIESIFRGKIVSWKDLENSNYSIILAIRVFIVYLNKKRAIRSFVIFLSMTNMTLNFPYKKWSFSSYCFLQYCDVDFLSIKKISNVKLHDGCKQKISKSFCFSTHTWIIIMDKSNGISGIRLSRKSMKGNTL